MCRLGHEQNMKKGKVNVWNIRYRWENVNVWNIMYRWENVVQVQTSRTLVPITKNSRFITNNNILFILLVRGEESIIIME